MGRVAVIASHDAEIACADDDTIAVEGGADDAAVLTEEEPLPLLAEIQRTNFTHYAPLAAFPEIQRAGPAGELTHYVRPGIFVLDSVGATTTNLYLEVGEGPTTTLTDMPYQSLVETEATAVWRWDMENVSGIVIGDAWVAAQFGGVGQAMPYPAAPSRPVVQARWYPNPHEFKLYVARGDGVTPATLVTSAVLTAGYSWHRLVSTPGVSVEWYTGEPGDEQLVASITDPALLPDWPALYTPPVEGPRFGLSHFTGVGFGGAGGMGSWIGPITLTFTYP